MASRLRLGSRISPSMVHSVWKAWWVTTALLLATGTITRFDLVTSEDFGPLTAGSEVAAAEDAALGVADGQFEAYPQVRYAGVDIALVGARVIPVNNSGQPIVVAELAVRNTTTVQARLSRKLINLTTTDGTTVPLDRFEYADHDNRLVVEPGETHQIVGVFKLRGQIDTSLDAYTLQIGESGRWPEYLGLNGEVVPSVYPKSLEPVDGADDPARLNQLVVELTTAATTLEYGVYRAPIGQHLAVVTVSVSGAPGALERGGFDKNLWTLTDESGSHRALQATAGERSVDGNTVSMELVFAYSTEASTLELLIGSEDTSTGATGDDEPVSVASFSVQAFE